MPYHNLGGCSSACPGQTSATELLQCVRKLCDDEEVLKLNLIWLRGEATNLWQYLVHRGYAVLAHWTHTWRAKVWHAAAAQYFQRRRTVCGLQFIPLVASPKPVAKLAWLTVHTTPPTLCCSVAHSP